MKKAKLKFEAHPAATLLQLDLGTVNGLRKPAGFLGVDTVKGDAVDLVCDLTKHWQWKDNSVDEVQSIHLIQQFTPEQRVHFVNELYRVLKPGAKAVIYTPYWASSCAYGNLKNCWPPVTEHWYPHLNKAWREQFDPHGMSYRCDFDHTLGYALHPSLATRNQEYQQHAITFFKEAAQDLCATVTKR